MSSLTPLIRLGSTVVFLFYFQTGSSPFPYGLIQTWGLNQSLDLFQEWGEIVGFQEQSPQLQWGFDLGVDLGVDLGIVDNSQN